MSISERQQKILQTLGEQQFITVQALAKQTFTSPSSIRRDLSTLENQGLVRRTHGGVTLPESLRGMI